MHALWLRHQGIQPINMTHMIQNKFSRYFGLKKIERLLPMISLKWVGSCYEHIEFPGEITTFASNPQVET